MWRSVLLGIDRRRASLAVFVLALIASGCLGFTSSDHGASTRPATGLHVGLAGFGRGPVELDVTCDPLKGSFANPGAVCAALARHPDAYLRTSGGCDHFHAADGITVTVTGRLDGHPISLHPSCPTNDRWLGLISRTASQPPSQPLPPSQLVVSVRRFVNGWPDTTRYTLNCSPASGTHPDPAAACDAVAAITQLGNHVHLGGCIGIYAGPSVTVTGTYAGRSVRLYYGWLCGVSPRSLIPELRTLGTYRANE